MQYDYYAFDLTQFYGPMTIKPLAQDSIVKYGDKKFRVDRWFRGDTHCYIFLNTSNNNIKPFGKTPSEVQELITLKKLIIEKLI